MEMSSVAKSACGLFMKLGFQKKRIGQETKDGKILGLRLFAVTAKAFDSKRTLMIARFRLRSFGRGVLEEPAQRDCEFLMLWMFCP